MTGRPLLAQAVAAAAQEWVMLVLLVAAAIGVSQRSLSVTLDLRVWVIVLLDAVHSVFCRRTGVAGEAFFHEYRRDLSVRRPRWSRCNRGVPREYTSGKTRTGPDHAAQPNPPS